MRDTKTKPVYRFRCEIRDLNDKNSTAKFIRAHTAQEASQIAKEIWGPVITNIISEGLVQ